MSRSIALLSGKGGSGKTTLALTIANMLSSCRIKVLLVDCDIVTNGATYFYEDRLSDSKSVISFFDLLYHPNQIDSCSPMEIIPAYYYFIPSIRKISTDITDSHPFDVQTKKSFDHYYSNWKKEYDVILFDCSAGYSDVLPYIVPNVDTNLVVLESDKVSMAAMRSLYLKLGPILPESKFYQIFNKVRPEEVKEYQRREGSFFTSIGAIAFDWSIRDAFSIAQVPTLNNTGIDFGMQLNSICSTLFEGDSYLAKLKKFGLQLSLAKAQTEQEKTRENLLSFKYDKGLMDNQNRRAIAFSIMLFFCVLVCVLSFQSSPINIGKSWILPITLALITSLISTFIEIFNPVSIKERKMKLRAYDDQLKAQQDRIEKLEQLIAEIDG